MMVIKRLSLTSVGEGLYYLEDQDSSYYSLRPLLLAI